MAATSGGSHTVQSLAKALGGNRTIFRAVDGGGRLGKCCLRNAVQSGNGQM